MRNEVVLVNTADVITGSAPKLEAHRAGLLHRAFSIVIYNSKREILLQQRAPGKYHSAGLWSNTCCSHPQPGEDIKESAGRRLYEEMSFHAPLTYTGKFHYCVKLENDLTENEIDYVFTGRYDGPVLPDPGEVAAYKWISPGLLSEELSTAPQFYTYWLPLVLKMI